MAYYQTARSFPPSHFQRNDVGSDQARCQPRMPSPAPVIQMEMGEHLKNFALGGASSSQ